MKILSVRNVIIIGSIAVGLAVAWGTGTPGTTSGEGFRGSCMPCNGTSPVTCDSQENKVCCSTYMKCKPSIYSTDECFTSNQYGCFNDLNCKPTKHQACITNPN